MTTALKNLCGQNPSFLWYSRQIFSALKRLQEENQAGSDDCDQQLISKAAQSL